MHAAKEKVYLNRKRGPRFFFAVYPICRGRPEWGPCAGAVSLPGIAKRLFFIGGVVSLYNCTVRVVSQEEYNARVLQDGHRRKKGRDLSTAVEAYVMRHTSIIYSQNVN